MNKTSSVEFDTVKDYSAAGSGLKTNESVKAVTRKKATLLYHRKPSSNKEFKLDRSYIEKIRRSVTPKRDLADQSKSL